MIRRPTFGAQRWRRNEADSVRRHTGIGDQGWCPNGTRGCPGPDGGAVSDACFQCFVGGAD